MPPPAFQGQPAPPRLLICGASGVLGNEVLRQLAGAQAFASTHVLVREPMRAGWRGVTPWVVAGDDPAGWTPLAVDTAVVMFEPPRLFYDRERALWTQAPDQLLPLARWLRECGVRTLAVVLPHAQMRLPEAVKQGLATMDEHAVVALHFRRVLLVRSAQKPAPAPPTHLPGRIARSVLGALQYMIPTSEQPVRAAQVARFVALALASAPPGIHVASSDVVWQAAQERDMRPAVRRWLAR